MKSWQFLTGRRDDYPPTAHVVLALIMRGSTPYRIRASYLPPLRVELDAFSPGMDGFIYDRLLDAHYSEHSWFEVSVYGDHEFLPITDKVVAWIDMPEVPEIEEIKL